MIDTRGKAGVQHVHALGTSLIRSRDRETGRSIRSHQVKRAADRSGDIVELDP